MIRYEAIDDLSESNDSAFRRQLQQSFPRFVAYCTIMRACRAIPQFRSHNPVVVGFVTPDGADMDAYESGVQLAAHGPSIVRGSSKRTAVIVRTVHGRKRADDAEIAEALATKQRVVLLAENDACVPATFPLAADAVVQVGPILPRHIIAGAKLCLGLSVSAEQADFIATVPLPTIVSTLRMGRSVAKAIELMRKATVTKSRDVAGPRLEDLHGLGEAGVWGRELAIDFSDWKTGKIGWEDVDRGILLSGPPGTGKTTFASALARSCDVHLVVGSLARWQARGHLGDLLKAMRGDFDEARKNAPAIIFIDEIDAVGDRERFNDHNRQYSVEVVAALLECIDGAEGREGVVVVGACNHPDRLDAALVRAGRLDKHVHIPLPDQTGREGILRWHLRERLRDVDLTGIVAETEGWNGASLEQLVRQGRRRARRARRELTVEDLLAEFPARVAIPEEVRRRSAHHEAGHAIVALVLQAGEVVSAALASTVAPNADTLQDGGGVLLQQTPVRERTRSQLLDDICVRLAGLAAEEVVFGDRSAGGGGAAGSDLHSATLSALAFEASYGLGDGFAYLASENERDLLSLLRLNRRLQVQVDRTLGEQFERAKRIVQSHRLETEEIARELLVRGSLTGNELCDLMSGKPYLKLANQTDDKTG